MQKPGDICRESSSPRLGHRIVRRDFLKLGALGMALPQILALRGSAASAAMAEGGRGFGQAKRCIVLFAWGGISHLDTWDMKPEASAEVRGTFQPIPTTADGIQVSEHLPRLAKQAHRLAIVRSVCHAAPSHRSAAYWNLTGHPPPRLNANWPATRQDWPCLGSLAAAALEGSGDPRGKPGVLPRAVCLPYHMEDGGRANGQDGGFLGLGYDPVLMRPPTGREYYGKSPSSGTIDLSLPPGVDLDRMAQRRSLRDAIESRGAVGALEETAAAASSREQALDMLLQPDVRDAFDLEKEPARLRASYGDHICGQSTLLARRLTEAGVPMVTVYCSAGDLNGSVGAHFDTHDDNFNRLKNDMLPPLDQASAALLEDLHQRGTLDETLVVWLTEFGRTPKINGGAGRDHYPNCYSVAFAGGGIRGGQVYGASDAVGAEPAEKACGPADLHATIFRAMGIDPRHVIYDAIGRPLQICDGKPLPLV
ncbi:MAG: DUF1501 domain-containing protein [Verrucomicrobiales bacterium]